ncbi:MAG TPA: cupin domain-containing protein [Dehalococcoidia bacterium]|jgi:quercetin dioxygenase-like cupin family protein|nr:cupin domain-containing protein [Dehalococcoidia bacterium]
MALEIRRVVTGHDKDGKAIVAIDDLAKKRLPRDVNSPNEVAVVWTTEGFPVDNTTTEDAGDRDTGITLSGGTVFRVVSFGPGNPDMNHRTDSVDYAIVMSGEIDMELDDGASVHLRAGDVLVQRGTIHNWKNRGTEPCVIAFILISADPVQAGGKVLHATIH